MWYGVQEFDEVPGKGVNIDLITTSPSQLGTTSKGSDHRKPRK